MVSVASWYHCSVKAISRSSGRTAVASAAYRAGGKLHDDQLDKTYDYTRRWGVETTFIVVPENAPVWAYDLERLWNEAQAKDNRKNSCLARECELALPGSLDVTDREALARDFAHHLVERYGVAVSVALHEPSRHGDDRNYHAHIMFTTRRMDEDGFGAKTRELDDHKTGSHEIEHIREYTATLINAYLEDAGMDERVDHRSFKDRGIDQEPTKHLGPEACAIERRGEDSRIGDENREIIESNQAHDKKMDALFNELATLDAEIAAEMAEDFLPAAEDEEPEYSAEAIQADFMPIEESPELSWEEQKQEAQRVFKNEDRQETAEAGQSILSWDEQKREAQRIFQDEDRQETANQIDQDEESILSWEEQKREAQSVFKDAEIQGTQSELSGLSWEEQKRQAQSAFNSPIVEYYSCAIQEKGEVEEQGLGKRWYDRTVAFFENLYYTSVDYLKKFVDQYISPVPDQDVDLEDR